MNRVEDDEIHCPKCGRLLEWDGYGFICVNEVLGKHEDEEVKHDD